MANDGKFLNVVAGLPAQEIAISTSAGAGDANKIAKLDATGRFDASMMPVGVTAEVVTIVASEALTAGDWVNIHVSTGTKVRKADATTAGKDAHGFVLAGVANAGTASVYLEGLNTAVTARTAGARQFLSTTAGLGVETSPSGSGNTAQSIGVAVSATSVAFQPLVPVTLA